MAKDVETTAVVLASNNSMPVSKQDLDALAEKRKVLKEFVGKQLKKGNDSDGDYSVIEGTKKPSLLKPGAEKLCQLFGLKTEMEKTEQILDHNGNFAMLTYRCTVIHIRTGEQIAQCEASCNSKEKKYATRSRWIKAKGKADEKVVEETPIYDVLNTLMKMAQKRAFVGAVIMATGASDFFTQDIETDEDAIAQGLKAEKPESTGDLGTKTSDMKISFAVSGNTMNYKDTLKEMGGKWNMNDKCWDFVDSSAEKFNKANSMEGLTVKKI